MLKYVWYRKAADLKLQIEDLRSKALEAYSEKTDSDISDEVDQGLISLVDKSTYSKLVKSGRARERKKKQKPIEVMRSLFLIHDSRLQSRQFPR